MLSREIANSIDLKDYGVVLTLFFLIDGLTSSYMGHVGLVLNTDIDMQIHI